MEIAAGTRLKSLSSERPGIREGNNHPSEGIVYEALCNFPIRRKSGREYGIDEDTKRRERKSSL